jgi:hypothetical protein
VNGSVFATAFVALYVGHMVADHVAQTDWQAAHKADKGGKEIEAMAGHLIGYTICQAVALQAVAFLGVPIDGLAVLVGVTFSVLTHGFIDRRWPVLWLLRHTGSADFAALAGRGMNGPYLADQSLHIGCLFISALIIGVMS